MSELDTTMWNAMPGDVNILVIGLIGAGKSTFVNTAAGKEVAVVGHGLDSCTDALGAFPIPHPREIDRRVVLLDTPGFDDTVKSDAEVLKVIRDWCRDLGLTVSGTIYLHEICQARAAKPKALLDKFGSSDSHQKIILVTTKWDQVPEDIGTHREAELRKHWSTFSSRFLNTHQSAWDIINLVLADSPLSAGSAPSKSSAFPAAADSRDEEPPVSPLDSVKIPSPDLEISFEAPSKPVLDQAPSDADAPSSDSLDPRSPALAATETPAVEGLKSDLSPTVTALQQVKNAVDPALVPDLESSASLALEIVKSIGTIPTPPSVLVVAAQNAGRVVITISEHAIAGHMVDQIPHALKTINRELNCLQSVLKRSLRRQQTRLEGFVLESEEEKLVLQCNERIQLACYQFEVKLALVATRLEEVVKSLESSSGLPIVSPGDE